MAERPVVVVVDDEVESLDVINGILEDDYQVICCNSGEEAIKALDEHPTAVVLCDQRMPHLTGDEVVVRLKVLYPETIRILVSAYTDVPAVVRALNEGGIFGFVEKPFDATHLLETVARAIEQRDHQKEKKTLLKEIKDLKGRVDGIVRQRTEHLEEEKRELMQLATRDELTGTFNRRYLEMRLVDEMKRVERYGQNLGVMMVDIDDFKRINDGYGHQVGDNVLRQVAGILRQGTRDVDLVARYGGEEFLVLTPATDEKGTRLLAERLRRSVAGLRMEPEPGRELKVTVSIGVSATGKEEDLDVDEIVRRADQAMYQAKKSGKDRVVTWTELKQLLQRKPQSVFVSKSAGQGRR